jgi:hypothetical protein
LARTGNGRVVGRGIAGHREELKILIIEGKYELDEAAAYIRVNKN